MPEVMQYGIEGENGGAKVRIEIEMTDIAAAGALLMAAVKRAMKDLAEKWAETDEGKNFRAKGNGGAGGTGTEDGEEVEVPGVGTVKKGALVRC